MDDYNFMVTRSELENYAEGCGPEWARNLLLLVGPDGYDGSYDEYQQLMELLNGEVDGNGQ